MSLQSRLADLISAVGADIKALQTQKPLAIGGTKTAAFAAAADTHYDINLAASQGNQDATLPSAPRQGALCSFSRVDTNYVTSYARIVPGGSDTLATGLSSPYTVVATGGVATFIYSGTKWFLIANGFNMSGTLGASATNGLGSNLVGRNSSSQFECGTATSGNHVVNKTYADGVGTAANTYADGVAAAAVATAAAHADLVAQAVPIAFSAQGALTVRTGKSKVQMLGGGSIVAVKAWLDTAATGATTFKVDVNKNGTTIYGTQANRPIWVASANAATVGAHSVTTYADGDQLSVDIDAVGSTIAGSDLTVVVYVLRTS